MTVFVDMCYSDCIIYNINNVLRYHEILYYTLFQDYKSVSPFYCNEVSLTFQHLFFSCEVPSLSIVFALSVTVFLQFIHFCLKHQFLINKCQSAKVGAENIIDVIDNEDICANVLIAFAMLGKKKYN
jgi:hypothetical protein